MARILMPLPYANVITFDMPVWYLDSGLYLGTIYDEDYGAFLTEVDEVEDNYHRAGVTATTKCIYIDGPAPSQLGIFARQIATKLKFVLNRFAADAPMALPYAVLLDDAEGVHIREIADLESVPNLHRLRQKDYKLKEGVDPEAIAAYYKTVRQGCQNNPALYFSLERFNSCLTRHEELDRLDRIVDITISLESLIGGTQEIRHRFALYNSFIAEGEASARQEAFGLFQALYDARSAIVHGDIDSKSNEKVISRIVECWEQIFRLANASINYYVFFLKGGNRATWEQHLKNLVFGIDKRIVD